MLPAPFRGTEGGILTEGNLHTILDLISACYVWVCVDFITTELPWLLYIYFVAFNFTMNQLFKKY